MGVPSLPTSPHTWVYPSQYPNLKSSSDPQDRLSSSHPRIPLSAPTNHAKREVKERKRSRIQMGAHDLEGECTAGRTREVALEERSP